MLAALLWACLPGVGRAASATAVPYDPSRTDAPPAAYEDFSIGIEQGARELPLRLYRAAGAARHGLILFSHGLGGSRAAAGFLGEHRAARGHAVLFVQHPGSDAAVWQDVPPAQRAAALRGAATAGQLLRRVRDIGALVSMLREPGHALPLRIGPRFDAARIGMAGHSFGARTTQVVAGQRLPGYGTTLSVGNIVAALVLSPSAPRGADPHEAFGAVARPWMLVTGTEDEIAIGARLGERLAVYPALPAGGKYELVLDGARHSAFVDGHSFDRAPRDPRHHAALKAVSAAFWDAWLTGDDAARRWLEGPGVRRVLAPADRWRHK